MSQAGYGPALFTLGGYFLFIPHLLRAMFAPPNPEPDRGQVASTVFVFFGMIDRELNQAYQLTVFAMKFFAIECDKLGLVKSR